MSTLKITPLNISLPPTRTLHSASSDGSTKPSRRVTSWGSAVSDGGSMLSIGGFGDKNMTPLPSPTNLFYPRIWDTAAGDKADSVWDEGGGDHHRRRRGGSGESDSSSQDHHHHQSRSKTTSFFSSPDGDAFAASYGALSPPPNPPSRNNSLRSNATTSPRKSWLDSDDGNSSQSDHSATPGHHRRTSDSPEHSPTLSPSPSRLRHVPSFDLNQLPPPPPLPVTLPILPHLPSTKPALPAIQTTLRESRPAGSPSPFSPHPSSSSMSSLPTAVEAPIRSGPRFPHFGPPSRLGTMDASPSSAASSSTLIPNVGPRTATPTTPSGMSASGTPGNLTPVSPTTLDWHGKPVSADDCPPVVPGEWIGEFEVVKVLGMGSFSRVALAKWKGKGRAEEPRRAPSGEGEVGVFALKLITRKSYQGNERMRISVVREVEVLKRIHHPSLVSLSSSFSTAVYTVLALDYAPGGELFDFLASWHKDMTEPLTRRMFGELASAVGWMHSIGLVHRDIKLENILLTARPFPCADPSTLLSTLPTPLLKLTDFGLSRFISPDAPLLATRCGSEAYAAPELIMGKKYDGRRTDAWALGVVLYALTTGGMPFVEDSDGKGRKSYLLKIAKAEFHWPAEKGTSEGDEVVHRSAGVGADAVRLVTPSLKALVESLLVRDPEKRAKVDDVWGMEWMAGEGRPERVFGWVSPPEAGDDVLERPWSRHFVSR